MSSVIIEILQERRVMVLLLLVALAVGWVMANGGPTNGGLKFGIDFSGGLRVPVLLEKPVDSAVMQEMVKTISTRASAFGLTEVRVRPVGDQQIYVEVPQANPGLVSDIQNLLSKQGVYLSVVDGVPAVQGDDLLTSRIYLLPSSQLAETGADWGVSFAVTPQGQQRFVQAAKGKTDYPIYMFVDRPSDAIIVLSETDLLYKANLSGTRVLSLSQADALKAARDCLRLRNGDVAVYTEADILSAESNSSILIPASNRTQAILSNDSSAALQNKLKSAGFHVVLKAPADMRPEYRPGSGGLSSTYLIDSWAAVGLKSAPTLTAAVTQGVAGYNVYSITGPAEGTGSARAADANRKGREMVAVLKGGALPVGISLGSTEQVPAPLGAEFLRLSVIGAIFAMLCISAMVALRYRTLKVVLPIIFISISEVIIIVAIIGSFSIDLAAMAGIISAIGVSVDAQIVVTDEILKKEAHEDHQERLKKAFDIIMVDAAVAICAMLPLLFSGLVQIIGFATTTILGYLLGVIITRPAYGVIVKHLVEGPHHASHAAPAHEKKN
ncbi:Protein-export membrane protein SecD [uncultured archaeon]|nr:Protein-export membrane protein SecD [uncultured archaeon]